MLYDQLLREKIDAQAEAACQQNTEKNPNLHEEEHHAEEVFLTLPETGSPSLPENDPFQEFLDACCELYRY